MTVLSPHGFYADCVTPSGAYKFHVNGQWSESSSGKLQGILCPQTNSTFAQVQGAPPAAPCPPQLPKCIAR